jgi:predicted glycosyltransferase
MKITIIINTPAQVHFWKNIIKILRSKDQQITILYRDYGDTIELANELRLKGLIYVKTPRKNFLRILNFPFEIIKATIYILKSKGDLVLDFGIYGAIGSKIAKITSIIFTDTEPSVNFFQGLQYRILMPLINIVVTPFSFRDSLGNKQIRFKGCKELAYLHPSYYQPKESIYKLLQIDPSIKYAVLRFNDLSAVHDIGLEGVNIQQKIDLVRTIEHAGLKVFISFEGTPPKELLQYAINIPKKRIHDALYYADLFITDAGTMATEAAILGTPVIRFGSNIGERDCGVYYELEKFGLIYNYKNYSDAMKKLKNLLLLENRKNLWNNRKILYLKNCIDVNYFMVNLILDININNRARRTS